MRKYVAKIQRFFYFRASVTAYSSIYETPKNGKENYDENRNLP